MLKMRLELLGNFEVLTAEDGEKGCEVAAAEQPDIILMDLEMAVVDGWEAARRLKGNSQTRDIPIIALSAHALAGERMCGQSDDGNVPGLRVTFQTPRGFPAVNNGHFEVHQDNIRLLGRRHLAPFLAVRRR